LGRSGGPGSVSPLLLLLLLHASDPGVGDALFLFFDAALAFLPFGSDCAGLEVPLPLVGVVVLAPRVERPAVGALLDLGEVPGDRCFLAAFRPGLELVEGGPEWDYVVEGRPVPVVGPVPGLVKSRSGTRALRACASRNSWRLSPAEASSHSSAGSMSAGSTMQAATRAG